MENLTCERCSGIKSGYWSPARKDDLVQKLGAIEHKAPPLLWEICGTKCDIMYWDQIADKCSSCPVQKLSGLIGGKE